MYIRASVRGGGIPLKIKVTLFLFKEVNLNAELNSTQIRNIQGECSV
jgi:hypothetical protein